MTKAFTKDGGLAKSDKSKQPKDTKSFTSTWSISYTPPTEIGFHMRWYVPKFVYRWAMYDLQFIRVGKKYYYGTPKKKLTKGNDLAKKDRGVK